MKSWNVMNFIASQPYVRVDSMPYVFPKCAFYEYGLSGSIQRYGSLCILALNIANEKLYSILLVLVNIFKPIRRNKACASCACNFISIISNNKKNMTFGDYFVISQFHKNINSHIFDEIMRALEMKLESNDLA